MVQPGMSRSTGGTVMTDAISDGYAVKDGSYAWASETRAHSMPTPEELEAVGYVKLRRHPWYAGAWLMKREVIRP